MKKPLKNCIALLLATLTVAASVFLVLNLTFLRETPFSLARDWQTPSAVACAPDGSMAVVENSKTLLSITDAAGRIRARVRGGAYDTDSFYYAEHVATDGQQVVIAEVRHAENSTFVQGERVILYDMNGERLQVLYAVEYGAQERPRQYGRISAVALTDGQAYFAWANGNEAGASRCENGEEQRLFTVTLPEDDALRAAYEPETGALCLTTKKGALGTAVAGEPIRWQAYGDGQRVLWSAGCTQTGSLWVSELTQGTVTVIRDGQAQTPWQGNQVHELTAAGDGVAFSDGDAVTVLAGDGHTVWSARRVALAPEFALRLILTWASAGVLLLAAAWLIVQLWRVLRRQPFSHAKRRMVAICACVLVAVSAVSGFLLSFTQKQMQTQSLSTLSQLAESVSATSGMVLGDALAGINALSDYGGADYRTVRRYMDAYCDASYRNGENLYYILYRIDGGMLWGVADYENTTGVRYPYCDLQGTVYGEVAQTGQSKRVEGEANIYGVWSYAVAPIYTSAGAMIGLVEIGANQYGEVAARDSMIRGLLTGVLVALLMAMLAFNEITTFGDHLAHRKVLLSQGGERIALGFIRPLIFLVFMADNMDAAYIPQLSANLGSTVGGVLPASLASAVPMSLQLLVIGISALLCGRALDRSHPRAVLLSGLCLQMLGAMTAIGAILTQQYWLLLLAKGVGGFGTGAAVVTCNAMPALADDSDEQQGLIAGLNVGVITGVVLGSSAGGYLADYLGYPAAYIGSAVCILMAVALTLHSLRASERLSMEDAFSGGGGQTFRFLRTPRVLAFLLCVMLPYMLMMYFKDYLFPLYASGLGKTESVIGSVMLLGGALAIFLGDALPGAVLNRLGAWNSLRLANLVCVYALALFALNPTFETAIIVICLLGLAASFGYAAQGVYYTELIRRGRIGDGKAMGLYSLFDNLGQTSGPLALGGLLFLGVALESGAIAVGATAMLGVATLVNRLRGKGAKS